MALDGKLRESEVTHIFQASGPVLDRVLEILGKYELKPQREKMGNDWMGNTVMKLIVLDLDNMRLNTLDKNYLDMVERSPQSAYQFL